MKKILFFGLAFTLITLAASAQTGPGKDRVEGFRKTEKKGPITRGEKFKLHKNKRDYDRMERRFKRDGHMSRMEKRKLHHKKQQNRHDRFRFKHNHRKRVS
ncbi:MAG: hypothetical protein KA821_06380 [Chitinophagaceae bacterium]|nr:hypothetical protein [Chitinophagaceae bacterium]